MPKTSEFDVLVFDPILLNGRLNPSVWTDLIPWLSMCVLHYFLKIIKNSPKLSRTPEKLSETFSFESNDQMCTGRLNF